MHSEAMGQDLEAPFTFRPRAGTWVAFIVGVVLLLFGGVGAMSVLRSELWPLAPLIVFACVGVCLGLWRLLARNVEFLASRAEGGPGAGYALAMGLPLAGMVAWFEYNGPLHALFYVGIGGALLGSVWAVKFGWLVAKLRNGCAIAACVVGSLLLATAWVDQGGVWSGDAALEVLEVKGLEERAGGKRRSSTTYYAMFEREGSPLELRLSAGEFSRLAVGERLELRMRFTRFGGVVIDGWSHAATARPAIGIGSGVEARE